MPPIKRSMTNIDLGQYEQVQQPTGQVATPPPLMEMPNPITLRAVLPPISVTSPDALRQFMARHKGLPIRRLLPPRPLGR